MSIKLLSRSLVKWLPLAVVIVMVNFSIYAVVQQNYRQNANDPQIQIAGDLVSQLNSGRTPASLVGNSKVDITTSLSPFSVVYSSDKKVFASGATLDKNDPIPPSGTFDAATKNGENWFSWEPKSGVRIAAVLQPYKDGYVLAGRSLKQVEYRESALEMNVFVALVGTLIASYIAVAISEYLSNRKA